MSSADQSSTPFKSSISDISLPPEGFKSKIPPHLLEGCDDATRWMMEEMSKATQVNEFVLHATIEHNSHLRALNGKTFKTEKGLSETKEALEALIAKADLMEPLFKPLSLLMRMWEYKYFRWATYLLVFFFFTYLLPFYLQNPMSLSGLWALFFGT